jgi:hypothetical protein
MSCKSCVNEWTSCSRTPHTHAHTHAHAHTHTHTHAHAHTHTHRHAHIHTYRHTHTYTNSNTHTHLVTHEASHFNDVTLHIVLENFEGLGGWHATGQELDQISAHKGT